MSLLHSFFPAISNGLGQSFFYVSTSWARLGGSSWDWEHTGTLQFIAVTFRGFDCTKLKSSLMTGLSFSQQNCQVGKVLHPKWCCLAWCIDFRVDLVPTCTSSGGFFSTSLVKLCWDSRTCAWTKGTDPSLNVKGRQKASASITLLSVIWTGKTCRQFLGGALDSVPISSICFFSMTLHESLSYLGPQVTLL